MAQSNEPKKRVLLRSYSIRALFAILTAFAILFAYVAYSLLTDYSAGVRDLIPWRIHLTLDAVAATAMLIAPFAIGFDGIARGFYVLVALAVLAVVATSQVEVATQPRRASAAA